MKWLRITLSGGRTPPSEQLLFSYGVNDTLKGDFVLTRTGAQEVMARYREHGVDLMLDYEHGSLDPSATPEQKKASGWGDLELRDDGIHLVNIRWSPAAQEFLKNAEFRYLSPAFNVNDDNEIIELINVALTNLPATHDQLALVAASRKTLTNKEHPMKMKDHLKAALEKHGGHEALAKHLGFDKEKLSKHLSGEPMSQEEMKHCSTKLGFELEKEDAPIDASINGIDVNKSKGSPSDGALSGLFELVGGEANVPHEGGEANENQSGGLHLSRAAAVALVKLTGTDDPEKLADLIISLKTKADVNQKDSETLIELRRKIETAHRETLITASMKKLTPRILSVAKKIPTSDLKEFLDSLPEAEELHEPKPEGANRMVTLTREDKEVAKLSGKSEKEFAEIKESIGDERLIALAGNVGFAADKAPKSAWDRKYADHFMTLSMTDMTPDGKPWKPAPGSKFSPVSKLP